MATQIPPIKKQPFTFEISLTSQEDTNLFQTSVTLASGDVTVSKDGGSFSNIGTLPTEISSSGVLTVALDGNEMDADRVVVRFRDTSGSQWCDAIAAIQTSGSHIDDLPVDYDRAADHILRRSWQSAADSSYGDTKTGRSLLGAVAKLVNKTQATSGSFNVYEDDDSTILFWQIVTTDPAADPITALDTA